MEVHVNPPPQEKLSRCQCEAQWMSSSESLPGKDCRDFYYIFPQSEKEALLNDARTCGAAAKAQKRDGRRSLKASDDHTSLGMR